ncbi:MAG: GNAT family N-acetyltransferase [Nanoarchaeota archaeon]
MQNQKIIIRKAKIKDIPDILILWKEFMNEHNKLIVHPHEKESSKFLPNATQLYKNFLRINILSRNNVIFVVKDSSRIKGFIIAQIRKNIVLFKIKKLCVITDLYLDKGTRGNKYSTKLFQQVVEWAKHKKIKYLSLNVLPQNKFARKVYAKWGFFENRIEMRKKI